MNHILSRRHGLLLLLALAAAPAVEAQVAELLAHPEREPELAGLVLFEPRAYTSELLALARDASVPSEQRVRAIQLLTLAIERDERLPDALPLLLGDPDPAVVSATEQALSPSGTDEALTQLLASPHASLRVRRRALEELVLAEEVTAALVAAVGAAVREPELEDEALDLFQGLGVLAEDPAAIEAFGELAAELFPQVPAGERESLLYAQSPVHPSLLARALVDPHPAIRCTALSEAALGPTRLELSSLVLAALGDPDPTVREHAIFVASEWDLPASEALPPLLDLARSGSAEPSSHESYTLNELAALSANGVVEDAVKSEARPWLELLGAFWVELLGWLGGVLAWLAVVRRVPRRRPVGRWRTVQCALAVCVPVAATFACCAWVASELREVAEVELFLPQPDYLLISSWLAVQLTAAGLVSLGAVWALQRSAPEA